MTSEIENWRKIIKNIDDDLVRAQYSYSIYAGSRDENGKILSQLKEVLESNKRQAPNCVNIFHHINRIHLHDTALTICRMMDLNNDTDSFSKLAKKAKAKEENLITLAKQQYLRAEIDEAHKLLQYIYVEEQKNRIKDFIRLEGKLRNSKEFKEIKHLRDKALAHRSARLNSSKANIKTIKYCLEKLEELLHIAYSIFLNTGYEPQDGYTFALRDAKMFWNLIIDK